MKIKEISIILFVIVITVMINISGVFDSLNEYIYNNYFFINRDNSTSKDIILVKIDNKTIKNLSSWPIKRQLYTDVLNNIVKSQPAVIGIVIAFTEKSNDATDELLYKTLKSFKNIILLAKYKKDKVGPIIVETPEKSIFPEIKQGHTLLNFSKNNIVVGYQPYKVYCAFAIEVSNLYFNHIKKPLNSLLTKYARVNRNNNYSTSDVVFVNYKRTIERFRSIPFEDVLKGNYKPECFKNKIVLIGITDRFLTTSYSTPFTSISNQQSTALELQAQFIDSIIDFKDLNILDNTYIYIFSIFIAVLFYVLTKKMSILLQGLYLLFVVILIISLNYSLFTYFALWFPPVLPLSLLISIFATFIYLTSFNIDSRIRDSLENLKSIDYLNLQEIPENVDSKVETLTSLIDIINHDRQAIKVIVDGVNSIIFVFNDQGEITWGNSKFKEYFKEDNNNKYNIVALFEDFQMTELKENIQQNGYYKKEHAIGIKDFICYVNLINKDNIEYVSILNDVTELKEIDRLKTDMVRMVSHELKNPLACIQLSVENIIDADDRNFTLRNAENIAKTTELLIDTVNNFLNLSRLENNMVEINPVKTDICEVINNSIGTQSVIATNKQINILFEPSESYYVMADPKQLIVVINNLLANAIKYSSTNSEVQINLEKKDHTIFISVKDSGIGIPEDEINMIFEKFFRSRNNKENNIEGTGLGLAIIKTIIEKHNGKIWAESKEKEGSTFKFTLNEA